MQQVVILPRRRSVLYLTVTVLLLLAGPAFAGTASAPCDAPPGPGQTVSVSGRPFVAIPSADGCTVYVSLMGARGQKGSGAIEVLKWSNGVLLESSSVALDSAPSGMALSHDGKLLVAATGDGATIVDTAKAVTDPDAAILDRLDDGGRSATYAAIAPDDRYAFISDERSQTISVIDLAKAVLPHAGSDAVVGHIPVGNAPVGLAVTPDGKTLYATSESVRAPNWPGGCRPEQTDVMRDHPEGGLFAIGVARAESDPAHAVLAIANAGCNPVRVVLTPANDLLYVTARDSNALLVFDPVKVLSHDPQAQMTSVAVGTSPVGVAATLDGKAIVANSARFEGDHENQSLTVVDLTGTHPGGAAVIGSVAVGAFPRELRIGADGKTLYVTNFNSETISVFDLATLPITSN